MSGVMNALKKKLTPLFCDNGILCDDMRIVSGTSGANNRHYCVSIHDQKWMVKEYFTHAADSRDRLTSEWQFLEYAYHVAPTFVAKPFFHDQKSHVAVFEWIAGESFEQKIIGWSHIKAAIDFFAALNQDVLKKTVVAIPNASESCFSLDDHLERVTLRLLDLAKVVPTTDEETELQNIVKKLREIFSALEAVIKKNALFKEYNALSKDQYCLSPSDFGFHNAIQKKQGEIAFVDFEYAGWDDPTKMACDFFSQIKIPVPDNYFEPFLKEVMSFFREKNMLIERAVLLKPIYLIKWCCIVLNVFLPQHLARRQFANQKIEIKQLQQQQLKIAHILLEKVHA